MSYHHLYLLYLYYFNTKRDYYECHDVLEELWLDSQRDLFLQGLIQVAVGLYHFKWKNRKGSILLFEGALPKLERFPSGHGGINLQRLRDEAADYLSKLNRFEETPFTFYDLTIEIVDQELQQMLHEIQVELAE